MSVEDELTGLILIDKNKDVLLIQPTKKINSDHKLYLHNLSKNEFVSTLFIQYEREHRVICNYNYFDLDLGKQIFYKIRINRDDYKYIITKTKEKKLTDEFISMLRDKSLNNVKVRRYKEL